MNGVRIAQALMAAATEAGLDGDERVQRWVRKAALTGNPRLVEVVKMRLSRHAISRIVSGYPFHVPTDASEVSGEIDFGHEVFAGHRVGFDLEGGHILSPGGTRFGKTNLVMVGISKVIGRVPFWAFDPKQDLRHLLRRYGSVYPVRLDRDFKFNPLRPFPQMRAKNWMQVLADVFCQPAELLSGSKAFALGELDELFMECPKPGPTMFDFLASVKEKMKKLRPSSVRGRYAERLATRLESVTSIFRDVYDCAVGFSMEDLIHENVVFETDGIETLAAQFQILCLLFANYHWRMETGRRGDDARQLIVIDEGQSVFSPFEEKKFASGIPFIDLMVQRAAEFGMVFMVCNQNTRLAYAIKENSPIKVCFNLCDGHDQGSIARTMSLDEEQRAELAALQVGEAVVQVGGRCPKPIKVRVDHFPIEKTVTNEEVAAHIRPWLKRMEAHVVPLARRRAQGEEEGEGDGRLAWEEEALLRDVHHVPGIDWRGRTERLRRTHGMSADAARKARERLERRGLVEAVRVKKAAKRGSSFVGLVLTGKGREYLRGCGVRVGKAGRGDARHRFWVDATKAFYERRGHRCEIEADLTPSVSVDLLVCGEDGHRTGVEVELSAGTVVRNIRKLLPLGLERVVIAADGVALLDEVRSKVEKELGAAALTEVEFVLAQDFLEG